MRKRAFLLLEQQFRKKLQEDTKQTFRIQSQRYYAIKEFVMEMDILTAKEIVEMEGRVNANFKPE